MKKLNIFMFICVGCLFALYSCNQDQKSNTQSEIALPPTNGEETRYNLNPADTLINTIDTNSVNSSI